MKHQLNRSFIMKGIYFLLTVILVACDQNDVKNTQSEKIIMDDTLKADLIGKWGGLGESTPIWDIRPDSIYYYDRSIAYPYKILNGDLIIYFPESKGVLKRITVLKDTMSFLDEQNNTTKGYRFTK